MDADRLPVEIKSYKPEGRSKRDRGGVWNHNRLNGLIQIVQKKKFIYNTCNVPLRYGITEKRNEKSSKSSMQ